MIILARVFHELRKTVFFQGEAHAGHHVAFLVRQGGGYAHALVRFVHQGSFLGKPEECVAYGSPACAEAFGQLLFSDRLVEIKLSGDQVGAQSFANCIPRDFRAMDLGSNGTYN